MAAVRQGRREAFEEIFARYRGPIWAFFRRRTPDRETAAELAQDVFVAVLDAAARYEGRGAFRSYLFGVATHLLAAWRRRTPATMATSIANADVAGTNADPADVLWVRRAIDSLDPIDRDVLMLREYEALTYDEIATLLGVPINTVRSRLFRARLALKAELEAEPVPARRSHP
jgi:RNA polymerase sigma-70 factor, ECF subfamily